jgi:N-acyl-D-aspartate/D-glutamate deacylase
MKVFKTFSIFLIALTTFYSACAPKPLKVTVLIKNGMVYDGINKAPSKLSIGIENDKIVYIGDEKGVNIEAEKVIDASGKIVCPGFIDPHTHADRDLRKADKSHNLPFLMQGVTTVVVGNDGNSLFPSAEFKTLYHQHGIGTNAILMAGHGTIRKLVVGRGNRKATTEELKNMQSLIQKEMDAGAFGMSTGLFYAPGSYSDTEEIIALSKIVAQNGGIYDSHIRDEGSYSIGLKEAIKEAIEIGRQAKLPIHISHIKCLGADVWNQSEAIIDLIEKGRAEGIQITANQYPYDASATSLLAATVPRWAESGGSDSLFLRYEDARLTQRILEETKRNIIRRGGADKLLIVKADDTTLEGLNLQEIADQYQLSPEKAVYKALRTGSIRVASFNMMVNDIHNFMKQDWMVTGSDGNTGHPRKYGSFPRKYDKYVKQEKVLDIATFINGSSSKTAEIFKIPKRGKLQEGFFADIIVFDPATFKDKANYTDAFQFAEGLEYSIINGKISVENGQPSDDLNGIVITK